MKKYIYAFHEGNKELKALLGGKGANLSEMTNIGLPVPPGFTMTTEACNDYYQNEQQLSDDMLHLVEQAMADLEEKTAKCFGDPKNPLLVSVRSGAVVSMPGMMDTILNLGLNDHTVVGLATLTGNNGFAYDSYRRFIQMFSDVVLGIPKFDFDRLNVQSDPNSNQLENYQQTIAQYKAHVLSVTGKPFPEQPAEQLRLAIEAVFKSWHNERAKIYRRLNQIPDHLGTAVNVQSMVFGNMGDTSGTGVAFTRNPSTGEHVLFGEFLTNAQGEDVVAGIRTPYDISELQRIMPAVYEQFVNVTQLLEKHYSDMQDIEFTIEREKLYLLQTRTGKRTAKAAIQIAVDLVNEGLISEETAVMRVSPKQLDQLLHPAFDQQALADAAPITQGLPASPGAASGQIYFSSEDVVKAKAMGKKAILARMETSPEDIEGMVAAEGILTARGGMTSHAAVVARGMGKCCVAGCHEVNVEAYLKQFSVRDTVFKEGDYISLDGNTGKIYSGNIPTVDVQLSSGFQMVMDWADRYRTLNVRTNADNPADAAVAVKFGAEGIGLCRTEHMFFEESRVLAVREMIVADNETARRKALDKLLPHQRADFAGIFNAMAGRPVTIRLLDPPLHEFLPHDDAEIEQLASDLNINFHALRAKIEALQEFNPMLGHRGCRLAITYPEIYEMQTRAIFEAVAICLAEGVAVVPEVMIPLVGLKNELVVLEKLVRDTAQTVCNEKDITIDYLVGTMIEVPRAALTADQIAERAEFFSFGTNDLTQMTFGFSRDDAGKFISEYRDKAIFENDPFESIDQEGVGTLMKIAIDKGRQTRPKIKLGICGEHGGEPQSVAFCHQIGLDYVSCSPYRVPIAKLAAAQAAIKNA